jgi:tRNA pseudouridine55 synthase
VIDGVAVIDKPAGMTSHDVVARCRKLFGQRRVGHAGTLDPDATGVLIVGLGRATRLLQYFSGMDKTYTTEIVLGVATTTLDDSGEVTGTWDQSSVTLADARAAAATLTGTIEQVPPMVSALKVGGRRLHELAREGVEVERAPRTVTVSRFDLEAVAAADCGPVFAAYVECSSGTYVRTLAADLGALLGGGAHLRRLRRMAIGSWAEAEAVPLDRLSEADVLPPADALRGLAVVTVAGEVVVFVRHGRVLERTVLGVEGSGPWAVLGPGRELLAVYQTHADGRVKPAVVLAPAS